MCTAVSFNAGDHYFGRNLDLEYHYCEEVVITPRHYPFQFNSAATLETHYAMIGMATVARNYPLYYEATNERGLSAAGLNFPGNAYYFPADRGKINMAPYELIPYLLGTCSTTEEVKKLLLKINITNIPFSSEFPLSPLHWIVSDRNSSLVIEQTQLGLNIYDNPVGVLTNNPSFPCQLENLKNYAHLSPENTDCRFPEKWNATHNSNGQGAIGLPGDWSSTSRFVRAAFVKAHSTCDNDENSAVSQFFHILGSVSMPRGAVMVHGKPEITVYSCCCNTDQGIYYYNTYNNSNIASVRLFAEDLRRSDLIRYPIARL